MPKKDEEVKVPVIDEVPQKKEEGTMTITKGQWEALLHEVANLRSGTKVEKPKRVTDHTATLRFYGDKPVVKFSNFQEPLVDGRRVGFVDLTLEDGEVVAVEYLAFLNEGNGEKVKIISQKATESVKNYGTVRAVNPDPKNQKTWDGGMIDLEVTSVSYQAEVEVIDGPHEGKKYSVPTTCLNA